MLTRILCWLGLHAWAYDPVQVIAIAKLYYGRKCYRCGREENPWEAAIGEAAQRRAIERMSEITKGDTTEAASGSVPYQSPAITSVGPPLEEKSEA